MPHIDTVIACRGEPVSGIGPPFGWQLSAGTRFVYVFQSLRSFVCLCVLPRQLVWECDGQNETSLHKLLPR